MSIKAAAFAAFIASSAASIEKQDTDQVWNVQEDKSAVVVRAYHKDSKTHVMLGCTAGSPVSLVAHRSDGKEGWFINLRVDDGEADQYGGGNLKDAPGIVFDQINTEQDRWKKLIKEMESGTVLKVKTDFSNGSTLARFPLDGFTPEYKKWLELCEQRGWMF